MKSYYFTYHISIINDCAMFNQVADNCCVAISSCNNEWCFAVQLNRIAG